MESLYNMFSIPTILVKLASWIEKREGLKWILMTVIPKGSRHTDTIFHC